MHVPADEVEDPALPYYPAERADTPPTTRASSPLSPFFLGCIGVTLFASGIAMGAAFIAHRNISTYIRSLNTKDKAFERTIRLSEVRQHNGLLTMCDLIDQLIKKYPQPRSESMDARCRLVRSGEDLVP